MYYIKEFLVLGVTCFNLFDNVHPEIGQHELPSIPSGEWAFLLVLVTILMVVSHNLHYILYCKISRLF